MEYSVEVGEGEDNECERDREIESRYVRSSCLDRQQSMLV